MNILFIRFPLKAGTSSASSIINPGGCLSSTLYCKWLVRYPPLGLLYSAALLKKNGHNIKIFDCELDYFSLQDIILYIKNNQPDIVCSSINIFNPRYEIDCLKLIRKISSAVIIARGHFPQLYPEIVAKNKQIDIVLSGKGFSSLPSIIETIARKKSFKHINGIVYQEDNKIIQNPPEDAYVLDELPFPARELINNGLYGSALSIHSKFTTMITSIGCPFKCTYCTDRQIPYQKRTLSKTIEEIEECRYRFGIREITFLDSTFTIDRERTISFCSQLRKHKIDIKWAIRTRTDYMDPDLLDELKKAGCISIHYGIESGSSDILKTLKRPTSLNNIEHIIAATVKRNFITLGFFMIGNSGDTINSISDTIQFAKKLPLHFAQFIVTVPLPYTDIYNKILKKFNKDPWLESYLNNTIETRLWENPDVILSRKDLNAWASKAYLAFYASASYLRRMIFCNFTILIILRQFNTVRLWLLLLLRSLFKKDI
ncbi:MAG: B12-binding domain-containing radical SAM protein [Candidatus Omnitrophica bacterium]|nr:B12-binding domain-containing radical SAM protein [Candidatus Omnitrophota bacterium]